jgi:16S rRNA C1402 N4-methylase RsmH
VYADEEAADLASVRELLDAVARNRATPVPVDAVARVEHELLAIRETFGQHRWRSAIARAIGAARRADNPLTGKVVEYVVKAARRQPPKIDPATTAVERKRIRDMLEASRATSDAPRRE